MEKVTFIFKKHSGDEEGERFYVLENVTAEAESDSKKAEIVRRIKSNPEYNNRIYPIPVKDSTTAQMLRGYFEIDENTEIQIDVH